MRESKTNAARHGFHGQRARLAAAALTLICVTACGNGDSETSAEHSAGTSLPTATSDGQSGALSLALQLAAGTTLNTVNYVVLGPNFTKSGAFDVSNSATVSAVIGGIPFGNDYTVSLNATSASTPPVQCDGSAAFSVTSSDVTSVPIRIECHEARPLAATSAPIPPFAYLLLGFMLMGLGATWLGRPSRTMAGGTPDC